MTSLLNFLLIHRTSCTFLYLFFFFSSLFSSLLPQILSSTFFLKYRHWFETSSTIGLFILPIWKLHFLWILHKSFYVPSSWSLPSRCNPQSDLREESLDLLDFTTEFLTGSWTSRIFLYLFFFLSSFTPFLPQILISNFLSQISTLFYGSFQYLLFIALFFQSGNFICFGSPITASIHLLRGLFHLVAIPNRIHEKNLSIFLTSQLNFLLVHRILFFFLFSPFSSSPHKFWSVPSFLKPLHCFTASFIIFYLSLFFQSRDFISFGSSITASIHLLLGLFHLFAISGRIHEKNLSFLTSLLNFLLIHDHLVYFFICSSSFSIPSPPPISQNTLFSTSLYCLEGLIYNPSLCTFKSVGSQFCYVNNLFCSSTCEFGSYYTV